MQTTFECHAYDMLFERFMRLRRVRLPRTTPPPTFAQYIRCADDYDAWASQRLRDWTDNPRWSPYANRSLHIN